MTEQYAHARKHTLDELEAMWHEQDCKSEPDSGAPTNYVMARQYKRIGGETNYAQQPLL